MRCIKCGYEKVQNLLEGLCWECNDNQIISEYDKNFLEIAKKAYKKHNLKDKKFDDKPNLTLPEDSNARKELPILSGCLKYFPAALAGVARISKQGNDKHNPGEPLHHARGKSQDHGDCILRHLMDTEDLLAAKNRGQSIEDQRILDEASQMAWRALAYVQELHEKMGKPMAPGAKE